MKIREDIMTNLPNGGFGFSCGCGACPPSALSRRKFLCAGTAGAVAAAATAAMIGTADRLTRLGVEARDRLYAAANVKNTRV
jgi:hypothetical protein